MSTVLRYTIKALSALPFWFWYGLSTGLYVVLFYAVGYRKKVVLGNLQRSFPEKSSAELQRIARTFYQHFCDILVEYVKLISIKQTTLEKRLSFSNYEVLKKYEAQKKPVIIVCGHYGNWEYVSCLPIFNHVTQSNIKFKSIYKVQKSKAVDDLLFYSRSRHGLHLVPTTEVRKDFAEETHPCPALVFLGDQSPSNEHKAYWMKFLNQDTGVLFGTERYAKMYDYAVVYMRIQWKKRGHYEFSFTDITGDPKNTAKGFITERHHQLLEEDIKRAPAYWLWTHKRWKKQKPENL